MRAGGPVDVLVSDNRMLNVPHLGKDPTLKPRERAKDEVSIKLLLHHLYDAKCPFIDAISILWRVPDFVFT